LSHRAWRSKALRSNAGSRTNPLLIITWSFLFEQQIL